MAWHIKPLLGIGTLQIVSAYDEAIDWEHSAVSPGEYVEDPIRHKEKLAYLPEQAPVVFRFRAPTEIDLCECDTTAVRIAPDGASVQDRAVKKEHVLLFRRCLEGIEGYILEGKPVPVTKSPAPDGRPWASEETMRAIPYEVATEIGSYLRRSQMLGDARKNA